MHIKHSLHIRTVLRRGFRFCLRLSSRRRCPRNLSLPPVRTSQPAAAGFLSPSPRHLTLSDLNHFKLKSKRYTPKSQFSLCAEKETPHCSQSPACITTSPFLLNIPLRLNGRPVYNLSLGTAFQFPLLEDKGLLQSFSLPDMV